MIFILNILLPSDTLEQNDAWLRGINAILLCIEDIVPPRFIVGLWYFWQTSTFILVLLYYLHSVYTLYITKRNDLTRVMSATWWVHVVYETVDLTNHNFSVLPNPNFTSSSCTQTIDAPQSLFTRPIYDGEFIQI